MQDKYLSKEFIDQSSEEEVLMKSFEDPWEGVTGDPSVANEFAANNYKSLSNYQSLQKKSNSDRSMSNRTQSEEAKYPGTGREKHREERESSSDINKHTV